ncbi:MAG TPA: glycosyltransferase family 39 protein [bacterium]|nr:glycosyltransferase family 39 protein [bacterium]HQO33667.1 glycosyltransferase family 39 protein [bacterium]HQP98672.1 glycosyltransferase family 39 protein [bacterium]
MIDITVDDSHRPSGETEKPASAKSRQSRIVPSDLTRYHLLFVLAALTYLYCCIHALDLTYVDFGDGNYLYLSWQLSQGEKLYVDLPSPQPPLHLFLGSILVKLGGGSLIVVRVFQAILRIVTGALVWAIAGQIGKSPVISALAGMIYIWLPEGVWWSRGYQSEHLLIFIQCLQTYLFLRALDKKGPGLLLVMSGMIGSLGVFTNMTAVPYLALQMTYLIYQFRPRFIPFRKKASPQTRPGFFWTFLFSLGIPCLLLLLFMNFYSQGHYIDQVWSRQIGTFPTRSLSELIQHVTSKLTTEYGDIVTFEGGFVLLAILGVLVYLGLEERNPHRAYLLWWAIASFGSILFVTKGGTVEYIFTLGEPAVAVFSAFFLRTFFVGVDVPATMREVRKSPVLSWGKLFLVVLFLIPTLCVKGGWLITQTMQNRMSVMEFPEPQVQAVRYIIEKYTKPDESIIATPFYAFASGRRLAAHFPYDFILAFAYDHEYEALEQELGKQFGLPRIDAWQQESENPRMPRYSAVEIARLRAEFDKNPDLYRKYSALSMFLELNQLLNTQRIPLVITNRRNILTWLPLLYQPLRDRYNVLDIEIGQGSPLEDRYDESSKILYSREEQLQFFIPRQYEPPTASESAPIQPR